MYSERLIFYIEMYLKSIESGRDGLCKFQPQYCYLNGNVLLFFRMHFLVVIFSVDIISGKYAGSGWISSQKHTINRSSDYEVLWRHMVITI